METQIDFLQRLEPDMALKVLMSLDDSADLIRASAVSRYWQTIVISNGLSKQLFVKRYPKLANISSVIELSHNSETAGDDPPSDAMERVVGERDHRAYSSLFRAITVFPQTYCICRAVSASSTDNYPEESIALTLDPREKVLYRDLYWSSKGSDDPETPEILIYKLTSNLCVITEINMHPFQASFHLDSPIYSSRFVRFRSGHPKCWKEMDYNFMEEGKCANDLFIWTYTSEVFPVAQENRLQRFQLPEPVVCVGGYLQIELLGRVLCEIDAKYYICVAHVQAIGRQLSPAFCVEFSEPSNAITLKYDAEEFVRIMHNVSNGQIDSLSPSVLPVENHRHLVWANLQDFMMLDAALDDVAEPEWVDDDDDDDELDYDETDPIFII
uniref:F-box protein At4g00755-like n=1 Tax=Erigeron canadensis TaxID=72917 RepID=UPI001CB9C24B|nr:F-box protein At4g00755-like [Erigeron canadensis]XP_043624041.1 F-box protein At4g00755-like [Erigeron canadensis]